MRVSRNSPMPDFQVKPAPLPPAHSLVQRGGLVLVRCEHGVESIDFTRTHSVHLRGAPLESEKWENCAACAEEKPK